MEGWVPAFFIMHHTVHGNVQLGAKAAVSLFGALTFRLRSCKAVKRWMLAHTSVRSVTLPTQPTARPCKHQPMICMLQG